MSVSGSRDKGSSDAIPLEAGKKSLDASDTSGRYQGMSVKPVEPESKITPHQNPVETESKITPHQNRIVYRSVPAYNNLTKQVEPGSAVKCSDIDASQPIEEAIDYSYQLYKLKIYDAVDYFTDKMQNIDKQQNLTADQFIKFIKEDVKFAGNLKLSIQGKLRQLVPLKDPDIEYFRSLDPEKIKELSSKLATTFGNFYKENFVDAKYNREEVINKLEHFEKDNDKPKDHPIRVEIPEGYIKRKYKVIESTSDTVEQVGSSARGETVSQNIDSVIIGDTKNLTKKDTYDLDSQGYTTPLDLVSLSHNNSSTGPGEYVTADEITRSHEDFSDTDTEKGYEAIPYGVNSDNKFSIIQEQDRHQESNFNDMRVMLSFQ